MQRSPAHGEQQLGRVLVGSDGSSAAQPQHACRRRGQSHSLSHGWVHRQEGGRAPHARLGSSQAGRQAVSLAAWISHSMHLRCNSLRQCSATQSRPPCGHAPATVASRVENSSAPSGCMSCCSCRHSGSHRAAEGTASIRALCSPARLGSWKAGTLQGAQRSGLSAHAAPHRQPECPPTGYPEAPCAPVPTCTRTHQPCQRAQHGCAPQLPQKGGKRAGCTLILLILHVLQVGAELCRQWCMVGLSEAAVQHGSWVPALT